jgi:hypothetical protein
MEPMRFAEFNIVYECDGNAIAVGLGAADTQDLPCGCHTLVTPIVRAFWFSKN